MAQPPELPKDWLEFMQKMWNPLSFPIPGMLTPTVNVAEIEKKKFLELRFSNLDTDLIYIVVREIESWYYAGIKDEQSREFTNETINLQFPAACCGVTLCAKIGA